MAYQRFHATMPQFSQRCTRCKPELAGGGEFKVEGLWGGEHILKSCLVKNSLK